MSETQSVSQGCFAFRPKSLNGKKKVLLPDPLNVFSKQLWHKAYKSIWEDIEKKIENIDDSVTETLLKDLVRFISDAPSSQQIPTAAILTGINLPDHSLLFARLEKKLKDEGVARSVATLRSADCVSVRHTVERTVGQLISCPEQIEEAVDSSDEEEHINLKRYQCTLPRLVEWYNNPNSSRSPPKKVKTREKKLIIILKDFETYSDRILHDFIQILSGYRDRLPIILIFGIATTISALSDILNHKTTSRLMLKTFQSQPSVYFLNNTLNKIFLTPDCPFQMSRKLLQFFTNVFLFYDFSVNRFIQAIKYCLMEHFREGQQTIGLLCTAEENINSAVKLLKHADLDWIRKLDSFKAYMKTDDEELLTKDDEYTRLKVLKLMLQLKTSIKEFYVGLNLLHILVSNLPQTPLGKHFREMYCTALNKDITKLPEYKECRQLLGFLSKEKLIDKLEKLLVYLSDDSIIEWNLDITEKIVDFKERLESLDTKSITSPSKSPKKFVNLNVKSRAELRQRVFELGGDKSQVEKIRSEILDELMNKVIPIAIKPFTSKPLWEVVTLVESDARYRVVPRVRAPIHTALNNPSTYLLCDCCKLKYPGEILPTMPDICIAYKLHLESGNLINMYDWLQSFNMIVNPGKDDTDVDPKIQARFTQAVSELEYMGFIKSTKKKMDHMQRLTWGGQSKV